MTRGDVGIIVFIVLATALSVLTTGMAQPATAAEAVIVGPGGRSLVDLAHDDTLVVDGRTGPVTFRVHDGSLTCVDADCPDHVCIRMGDVRPGRPVVCAPNGVSAMLNYTEAGQGYDAVSR